MISAASRCLDPKRDWAKLLDCARNPKLRFVISNTTEAGIAFDPACKAEDTPPSAFPAKLTLFLHERWKQKLPGVIILSCELIDHNGQGLHRCVQEYVRLWGLEETFASWLEKENVFCSTLEDKSCGCVQKGGSAQITDVLEYAESVTKKGLNLLSGPGNDLVSATDLTAAGAHIILFTTGRGTPFGAPAPTVKISTNTALFEKKGNWIDFNAGSVAEGEDLDAAGERLLDYVLGVASGEKTKAEQHGAREIAIFKDGVTL